MLPESWPVSGSLSLNTNSNTADGRMGARGVSRHTGAAGGAGRALPLDQGPIFLPGRGVVASQMTLLPLAPPFPTRRRGFSFGPALAALAQFLRRKREPAACRCIYRSKSL